MRHDTRCLDGLRYKVWRGGGVYPPVTRLLAAVSQETADGKVFQYRECGIHLILDNQGISGH